MISPEVMRLLVMIPTSLSQPSGAGGEGQVRDAQGREDRYSDEGEGEEVAR